MRRIAPVAAALLAVLAACAGSSAAPHRGVVGSLDWTRFGYDAARSDAAPGSGVTVANVASLRRRRVALPGTVDSSAIYLHGVAVGGGTHDVFVVTTTYGKTIAVDAATGALLWTFTPPGYASFAGSAQITNASPVADPSRQYVYAAAPDGYVRKLALADGHQVWATAVTRLATREKLTASLNLDGGHVLASTGGYVGDAPPYQGHVAVLDAASGRLLAIWNSLCSDRHALLSPPSCPESDSAIWARSGVVVEPGSHRLLVATGNGRFDGRTYWGDSLLELTPTAAGVVRHWTPRNFQQLQDSDADLGSTGPALLAGGYVAQGGKDGKLRLLRLARLAPPGPGTGGEVQTVPTPGGSALFSSLAVWRGTWLFVADDRGTQAWRLRGGRLVSAWQNGTGGTSPVVAGGLVYVYDAGGGGVHVYAPGSGRLLATLPAGAGHWQSPIVADGRVAIGEGNANDHRTSGVLDVYSLP